MAEIPMGNGRVAMVDDSDLQQLSLFNWRAVWNEHARTFYAVRNVKRGLKWTTVSMHRELLGGTASKVDHRDHNGLNNRRGNLRNSDDHSNRQNAIKRTPTTSKYKGVCFERTTGKWRAYIASGQRKANGRNRQIHLGRFASEVAAARAYDAAAKVAFGEFSCLNFPESEAA